MSKFDRYLIQQLLVLFGFFSLILVLVYWINRAVGLFDQLIADGQSALVFLEFTALTLPNVIRQVLPMSAFAATVFVINRLNTESELVVVQATGFSPFRLARPVIVFGIMVATFVAVLGHLLVPLSLAQLGERQSEIAEDVTAGLLNEGEFMHPSEGVTFYIREVTPSGELLDLFITDASDPEAAVTYTAQRALIVRGERGPSLLMFEGLAQAHRTSDNRLTVTRFQEFAFDMAGLIEPPSLGPTTLTQLATPMLFNPSEQIVQALDVPRSAFIYAAHERINDALWVVVTAIVGYAGLIFGAFSRFGAWRQIIGALVTILMLDTLENAMTELIAGPATPWPFAYAASLLGLAMSFTLIAAASKTWRRGPRRVTSEAPA
ncbi:MAG: LptF/LptG family permease [Pseudomonadota bacterium]